MSLLEALEILRAEHVTRYGRSDDPFVVMRDKVRRTADGRVELKDGPLGPRTVATVDREVRLQQPMEFIVFSVVTEAPAETFRRKAYAWLHR